MELAGTIAFACSGAILAIRKRMDLLGICIMGVVTAVGGGMLRDILLGVHPPMMFRHPGFTTVSAVTGILVFIVARWHRKRPDSHRYDLPGERAMFAADTVGLAAFTVSGVAVAREAGYGSVFLLTFLGTLTGTGGGVIRDLLAQEPPYIFTKHVYACASIAGGLLCALLWDAAGELGASAAGAVTVILIRALAAHYRWNLPRVA